MKKLLFISLFFLSISFKSEAQQIEITELTNQKKEILNQIKILTDSINTIELKIISIRSKEIKKMVTDITLKAMVKSGAKMRKTASSSGELIIRLNEDKEVVIMDYKGGYFDVCIDSVCGYIHDFWIKKDFKINELVRKKETEEKELKAKNKKAEYAELQKKHIKKYGQKTYNRLRKGDYWLGMTKEMAVISLGSPKKVNSNVGSWGNHEQWVYNNNIFLYFEEKILTSYQD